MFTRQSSTLICMVLLMGISVAAWANEVDESGNWIATPREAEMMERGFLYFPPRVVRKPGAVKTVDTTAAQTKANTENKPPEPKPPEPKPQETVPAMPNPTVVSEPQAVPVVVAETAPAPAAASTPAPSEPAGQKILQTNPQNRLSAPARFAQSTAYAGAGTGVTLGLSTPLPEGGAYRVELSDGFKSPQANKSYGGTAYRTTRDEQHLGVFVDWPTHQDNWFVTGGVTLNNHHIRVQTVADASLSIDYKLPTLTPYVGVRYVHKPYNNKGWEGFGEVGVLVGKLNASTTTTSTDTAAVQAEVDRIRQSIYRWSVVPKAVVGLSYKY